MADPPPPPIRGGTLVLSADHTRFFAADAARDALFIVDLDAARLEATVSLEGCEPWRMVEGDDGVLAVVCRASGELLRIDPDAAEVVASTQVCATPRGVRIDSDDAVWVACAQGLIVRVEDDAVVDRIAVDGELRDIVDLGPPLRVSTFRGAQVLTVDEGGAIVDVEVPPRWTTDAHDNLTRSGAAEVDAQDTTRVLEPNVAWRTTLDADGGWTMLHQLAARTIDVSAAVWAQSCFSTQSLAVSWKSPKASEPSAMVISGMSAAFDLAYDAAHESIAVVGSSRDDRWGLVLLPTPFTHTVAFSCGSAGGGRPQLDGPPTAVVFDGHGRTWVQLREPAVLVAFEVPHGEVDPVEVERVELSSRSVADTGHDLFHLRTNLAASCVACHPEGGEDGRLWQLGTDEERRTMSLALPLEGSEPFHWRGELEDMGELHRRVRVFEMEGTAVPDDHVVAFERWIFSIAAPNRVQDLDVDAVEDGAQAFEDAGCTACHQGTRYNLNTNVALGVHGILQVPSLLGVRHRAPYMHDGRAEDLRAAVDDMMGFSTSRVEDTEVLRENLVTFLRSL